MTPVVGILSDKSNTRFGKRMPWYIFGIILVIPTFLGIFSYPRFINDGDVTRKNAWYLIMPAVFNIGWASVQISHMSIVNSITMIDKRRDLLINNRNGFTSAANFVILGGALYMFSMISDQIQQFRILCFICLLVGTITSIIYIFFIREIPL